MGRLKARGTQQNRILDFVAYVAIAVGLVLGILWYSEHCPNVSGEALMKWGGLTANSLVLYGYTIKDSKRMWRQPAFWAALGLVFCVHIVVFTAILKSVEHWKVLWFMAMYPIELPVIAIACDWAVDKFGKDRPVRGSRSR